MVIILILSILITTEPAGTLVGFEETQLVAIQSSGATRGNQVVPDIVMMNVILIVMMNMIIVMMMMMKMVATMLITMLTSASAG